MNLYLDFLPMMAGPDGAIRGPAGDGRLAAVSRADVAAVTAAVVAGDDGDGQAYAITGREALTIAEVAETLAAASGKRIEYVDETLAEARESRGGYGAPDWQIDAWISTYTAIAAGELAGVSDTVERMTGRPAQTLGEFSLNTRARSPTCTRLSCAPKDRNAAPRIRRAPEKGGPQCRGSDACAACDSGSRIVSRTGRAARSAAVRWREGVATGGRHH